MFEQFTELWSSLPVTPSIAGGPDALRLFCYLIVGGCMSLMIRGVYHRFGNTLSHRESITRIFPLLTLVTIGVIAVVKTSLALSLGLVGALSIVRFRAAIKEPEELVYLFLCIGIGLSLGAEQLLIAISLLVAAIFFIWLTSRRSPGSQVTSLLLTISGDAQNYFSGEHSQVMASLTGIVPSFQLLRFDVEGERGQLRVQIDSRKAMDSTKLLGQLHGVLPGCDFSLVNLNSTL